MSGYPIDKEDFGFITRLPSDDFVLAFRGHYEETRLDPRQLIKVENQARLGSCAGHSLSSVDEWNYALATGGKQIQLSRAYAYFEAQKLDGIRGDSGSTISAGVKLVTQAGIPEESYWQYPSRYDNSRPANYEALLENAAKYKLKTVTRITSYESYRTFLGAGIGGIHQGISWGNSMNKAVVESFSPGGGGHSICALCLSERTDKNGEPYAWILNSWSESFGNGGWQEWSPAAIRQMLSHRFTSFVGLSDMPSVKPRKFSLEEWKGSLRG